MPEKSPHYHASLDILERWSKLPSLSGWSEPILRQLQGAKSFLKGDTASLGDSYHGKAFRAMTPVLTRADVNESQGPPALSAHKAGVGGAKPC